MLKSSWKIFAALFILFSIACSTYERDKASVSIFDFKYGENNLQRYKSLSVIGYLKISEIESFLFASEVDAQLSNYSNSIYLYIGKDMEDRLVEKCNNSFVRVVGKYEKLEGDLSIGYPKIVFKVMSVTKFILDKNGKLQDTVNCEDL